MAEVSTSWLTKLAMGRLLYVICPPGFRSVLSLRLTEFRSAQEICAPYSRTSDASGNTVKSRHRLEFWGPDKKCIMHPHWRYFGVGRAIHHLKSGLEKKSIIIRGSLKKVRTFSLTGFSGSLIEVRLYGSLTVWCDPSACFHWTPLCRLFYNGKNMVFNGCEIFSCIQNQRSATASCSNANSHSEPPWFFSQCLCSLTFFPWW